MDCVQGSICFEMMKGVPAGAVTLVIGSIAGLITWRQYQVARAKLKLDLFEKRFAIFRQTWRAIENTAKLNQMNDTIDHGWTNPFNILLPEAVFLFDKEIADYLNELSMYWRNLHRVGAGIPLSLKDDAPKDVTELQMYFIEQVKQGARARFGVYLGFENWK